MPPPCHVGGPVRSRAAIAAQGATIPDLPIEIRGIDRLPGIVLSFVIADGLVDQVLAVRKRTSSPAWSARPARSPRLRR